MKRIIKSYYPMLFSIAYMFLLSFMMKGSTNNFIALDDGFLMFIFTLIVVGGIFAQIIGFIVHASKNKKLKNKVLWAFLIYFLNIFIIPYYNLKYVMKEKKVTLQMVVFVLLMILAVMLGIDRGTVPFKDKTIIVNEDYGIQMEFGGTYVEREMDDYDLYATDFDRDISIGTYVYTTIDDVSVEEIHISNKENVIDATTNFKEIRDYESVLEDRIIISKTYIGEMNGNEFLWNISTIEYLEEDLIVNVVAGTSSDIEIEVEKEFEEILLNVKLLEE